MAFDLRFYRFMSGGSSHFKTFFAQSPAYMRFIHSVPEKSQDPQTIQYKTHHIIQQHTLTHNNIIYKPQLTHYPHNTSPLQTHLTFTPIKPLFKPRYYTAPSHTSHFSTSSLNTHIYTINIYTAKQINKQTNRHQQLKQINKQPNQTNQTNKS